MTQQTFKSSDVVGILGINLRQLINWTEKDLIVPHKQARGAGSKREYSYLNLLELAVCRELFKMGLGVYPIKEILVNLREDGDLEAWAKNYQQYCLSFADRYYQGRKEVAGDHIRLRVKDPSGLGGIAERIPEMPKPEKEAGTLYYVFRQEGAYTEKLKIVSPWTLNETREALEYVNPEEIINSDAAIIINLGKIKEELERKITEL